MSKSITQDMAYRQSLMKYAEKYAPAAQAGNTTRAGHSFTSGNNAGTEAWRPWPVSPGILIATRTSTQKPN